MQPSRIFRWTFFFRARTSRFYLAQDIIVQIEGKVNVREEGRRSTVVDDSPDLSGGADCSTCACWSPAHARFSTCEASSRSVAPGARLHLDGAGRTTVVELIRSCVEQTSAFFSHIAVVGAGGVVPVLMMRAGPVVDGEV